MTLSKQDRYRVRKLSQGLCSNCGGVKKTKLGTCKKCRLKKADREKRKRDAEKERGSSREAESIQLS
jgi:predicted ATP-dependent serine protease